ncbi:MULTISPECIES: GmrSD restriction endonuclease domain-containing protein [unclassified Streptomyces]|uniref:GmrSD restriction endonuclease domain-containing protein n=1 Tax=unclassified Streptomyces TaxID=2593676 RepID=UPI002E1A82E2
MLSHIVVSQDSNGTETMEVGHQMRAEESHFADLVQGRAQQFQVPLYQRTYSWTDKQLAQLWGDILDQAELVDADATASTHFLGSVVLAPSPQNEATFPRWLVVDGQQRLTTLSLALAAIRDHIAGTQPDEAERIDEEYLINKRKKGADRFRLLPTQADRPQYAAHVHGVQSEQSSGDRVAGAYRFFRRKLVELVETDDPAASQDLLRIEQAITSRLTLVTVTAERGDNVHRIFESLNNTGLKLSQADLLRNYLFMRLPTRDEQVYETHWLPLQSSLSNDELEQLMWLQLVLDGDDRVRRQDLYTAQQQRFERQALSGAQAEADVEAYIKELHRRSAHFRKMIRPEEEPDPLVRGHLKRLHNWQAVVTYPALMLILDRRDQGDVDSAEAAQALSYVESFLVRRTICRVPTNNLNRIFQSVPAQLPQDVGVADGLHQLLSAENRLWPDDEELREKIRTAPFYQYGRPNQRRLVLQRLEESYDHPEPVDFASAQLTIEHVMPQSPGDEWMRMLDDDATQGESAEDLHARLQHTLGNLTLTGVNSELSNHPFERKQGLLEGSHLEMNRRIAATERWGVKEILARAGDLTDRAIRMWPAPLAGVGRAERSRDWRLAHQVLAALPHGTWTSYGDVAACIGSGAQAVGVHLANTDGVVNAYRVLNADGKIADGFRWTGSDGGDVRARLGADGIHFTATGAADPAQRLSVDDLALLLDGAEDQSAETASLPQPEQQGEETRAARFLHQLAADDTPATVSAVRELFAHWEKLGGWIGYGAGDVMTSAFLMLGQAGAPGRGIWPLTLYPGGGRGGTAEVVFVYLSNREPFTDRALRAELLNRLNELEGVSIPEGKLELRPSFRLSALEDDGNRERLFATLAWFRDCWEGRDLA